jgi:hypothetical protein
MLRFLIPAVGDVSLVPVWPHAGAPVNGTSGTMAGYTQPGDLLVDTTNKILYQNTNTQASPTWTVVGSVAAITSGTIDGVTIGGTTPGAVTTNALHVDTGTKTATASSGAATLNKMAGVITSESLSTAAGSDYTLTLTNSDVAAADQVFASAALGTATTGEAAITSVKPAANSVVIKVRNIDGAAAFNGTVKISFLVVKN